jgi:hypothetical protein
MPVDPRPTRLRAVDGVGRFLFDTVAAFGDVWVLAQIDEWVARIDGTSGEILTTIAVGDTAMRRRLTVTGTAVVVGGDPLLFIDPTTGAVTEVATGTLGSAVVADGDDVWTASFDGTVRRVRRGEVTTIATLALKAPLIDLAVSAGLLWALVLKDETGGDRLLALDPETGVVVHEVDVGPTAAEHVNGFGVRLMADEQSVVVGMDLARPQSGELVVVDPYAATIVARPRLRTPPVGIALTPDRIWATQGVVDRRTMEVTDTALLGGGLTVGPDGTVWGTLGAGGGTAVQWSTPAG